LPFTVWWPQVTPQTLRKDAAAAVTGAAIVLPQAVAFATVAGLPPQYGFYAAMAPAVVAAFWGSSWHLVSGPTTAISVLVLATLSPLAEPGGEAYIRLAITLALLVGLMQFAMGVARLGAVVNFISHTVIVGFTAGAACLIFASQIRGFFGLDVPRGSAFHEILIYAAQHVSEAELWAALIGCVTLATGLLARQFAPRLPYMILAMVVGSVLAALLNFTVGADRTGILTVGALPSVVPALSVPDLSFTTLQSLLFPAAIVATIGLTEAVAIARSIATRTGQRLDSDQEFIGQGLSNIAGSFLSAYPSSGSFNRSGVNLAAGARTPLAAAMSAVFLFAITLVAAPLVAFLPVAAMAAILFIVAWGLFDWHHIGHILRRHPRERIVLGVTWVGVLVDLEKGLFIGVLVSLLYYLYRTSQPVVQEIAPRHAELALARRKMVDLGPEAPACPQLAILRVRGSIYFGAVEHVREQMHAVDDIDPRRTWLLLVAQGINFVDIAGAYLLAEEARRRRELGGGLVIVGAQPAVLRMLDRAGALTSLGAERLRAHKPDALRLIYPLLDSKQCQRCPRLVFQECQTTLPDGTPRHDLPGLERMPVS
jgi:SulP family sulfate permease